MELDFMKNMVMELDLVLLTMIFFVVLCLGTMITLLKRKAWLFPFIPIALVIATSIIYTYTDLLGTPTKKELPEEFFLIHHHVDEELDSIYLWIMSDEKDVPMAYQLPYEQEVQEELDGLKEQSDEDGSAAIIRGHKPKENENNPDFELYYFIQQKYLRKDANPVQ